MTTRRKTAKLLQSLAASLSLASYAAPAVADPPGALAPATRDLSTDRPDKTESPYTVPAGRFQLEADLLTAVRDAHGSAWEVAPFNIKIGLLNSLDLQLAVRTYYAERNERAEASSLRSSGLGDMVARAKLNLHGNDTGPWAVAVMPFVKIPTDRGGAGNGAIEGGIIVPFATDLPRGWSLGAMTEFDVLRDGGSEGHYVSFINSVTVGHGISSRLAGYVEFYSEVPRLQDAGWVGTVDAGVSYRLAPDVQLDTGLNCGVTTAAADLSPFVGISWRF
jgi:hypothetical protein